MRVALRPGAADLTAIVRSALRDASIEYREDEDADSFAALITVAVQLEGSRYRALDDIALVRIIDDGILSIVGSMHRVFPKLVAGSRIIHIAPCSAANHPGSIGTALVEAAIVALTRSSAAEFTASSISVNAILPRASKVADSAISSTLRYLLHAPTSVTGLSLVVPCVCHV